MSGEEVPLEGQLPDKRFSQGQEERPEQHTPRPRSLDIVKIDGQWAQVMSERFIRYLKTGPAVEINWDKFRLVPNHWKSKSVGNLIELDGETFTEEEMERIHWDAVAAEDGQTNDPELQKKLRKLRLHVTVFGEFESKK